MGSSGKRGGKRHWSFAAGLAARGLAAGCFAAGSVALLLSGRPALALIAGGVAITALFALVRAARQAERTMRELADQLAIAADDRPLTLPSAFADLDAAIVRGLLYGRETGKAAVPTNSCTMRLIAKTRFRSGLHTAAGRRA